MLFEHRLTDAPGVEPRLNPFGAAVPLKFLAAPSSLRAPIESPLGASIAHTLPFSGERVFGITFENGHVFFRSEGGKQEFDFGGGFLRYSENAQVMRLWRKLATE